MKPEIITYTGKVFTPFDPQPEQIDIVDIAHALSMQCRFTGHTLKFYSVAEHCFNVSEAIARDTDSYKYAMYGLLHDASEAYMADISSPVKQHFPEYKLAENKIQAAIFEAFGLDPRVPPMIKAYDQAAISLEAKELMPPIFMEWYAEHLSTPVDNISLPCWSPDLAEHAYLKIFDFLKKGLSDVH